MTDASDSELLDSVASELLKAIETKDKGLLTEALTALIMHTQEIDQEQDQMEQE